MIRDKAVRGACLPNIVGMCKRFNFICGTPSELEWDEYNSSFGGMPKMWSDSARTAIINGTTVITSVGVKRPLR
jgi:hypothetical protein